MNVNGTNAVAKAEQKKGGTLSSWLSDQKSTFLNALPKNTVNVDRFLKSAQLLITANPAIQACDKGSIARSLIEAASLGMDFSPVLGQCYLIPYNENVNGKKIMTAHFQMGYKGILMLARRSETIKTIAAECIHENDEFTCELASGRKITHRINIFEERGPVIGYYCLVELTNGGEQFAIMSKKDAEKFRDTYSKSYIMAKNKESQNWSKNFDAMALKTCIIKALKLCPISVEMLEKINREEMEDSIDFENPVTPEVEVQVEKNPIITEEEKQTAQTVETTTADVKVNTANDKRTNPPQENYSNVSMSPEEEQLANQAFEGFNGDIF